jgi:putative ABC transport system permease protein
MADVDALFENGPQRVLTTTEAEFQRQFVSMMGNIPTFLGWIGGGVLFAIFLATLNTMLMAGRERTRDLGVIKALGFNDRTAFFMLLTEALFLCVTGGLLGVGLALLTPPVVAVMIGTMLPGYMVTTGTAVMGVVGSMVIGLVAGLLPALRAQRLRPVDALRSEG